MNPFSWSRRRFMASAGAAALARGAVARGHGGRVVRVTGGAVRGIASDTPGVTAWLGIPFAAPPVGPLRWRPPQPVQPWPGIRAADRFSASPVASPQDPHSVYFTRAVTMDEDCLTLNVWAPARPSARPRPVMVWIYGGAFVYGASDDALYDGARMARHQHAVDRRIEPPGMAVGRDQPGGVHRAQRGQIARAHLTREIDAGIAHRRMLAQQDER